MDARTSHVVEKPLTLGLIEHLNEFFMSRSEHQGSPFLQPYGPGSLAACAWRSTLDALREVTLQGDSIHEPGHSIWDEDFLDLDVLFGDE